MYVCMYVCIYIYIYMCVYVYIYICTYVEGEISLDLKKYASLKKNTRISMVGPIRLVDYLFTAPGSLRPRAFTRFAMSIINKIIIIKSNNSNNNQ